MYTTLKTLAARLREGFQSSSGATTVEYAVMLALIVLVSMSVIQAIGTWTANTFAQLVDGIPV